MTKKRRSLPLCTALRDGLRSYSAETWRHDLLAGLTVSLIALPLAMALSIAVGLPPRHGIYTAIVAGIAAALFGGSATQVSGPTAAFVVIVAPIVRQYGIEGLIWAEIMAGMLLVAGGFLRVGKLIDYVPHSVVTGFTAGIAVVIATISLNDFFGLGIDHPAGSFVEKAVEIARHLHLAQGPDALVGALSLLVMVLLPRVTKKIPAGATGVIAGGVVAWLFHMQGAQVDTIATRFSYAAPDGGVIPGIQPYPPEFAWPGIPDYATFRRLFPSALVIAALAALESLLSATVADRMMKKRHDSDAELSGIGIANVVSGLFSGIPATGAIARTAANIHAGGRTPVASAVHAALILVYILTLAPLINMIPMSALAALLLLTAWRMSHAHEFMHVLRRGRRQDAAVLATTFALTVLIDMVAGVSVGMIMAGLLFMKEKRGRRA